MAEATRIPSLTEAKDPGGGQSQMAGRGAPGQAGVRPSTFSTVPTRMWLSAALISLNVFLHILFYF